MNLTIAVHNIGSFSLLSQLEMSLRMIQDKMGLSEEDLDEIKARNLLRFAPFAFIFVSRRVSPAALVVNVWLCGALCLAHGLQQTPTANVLSLSK